MCLVIKPEIITGLFLFSVPLFNLNLIKPFFYFLQGLLGPKKELWDLLQLVEKTDPDAMDITASVRELPTVK
jgi:hypothetical protein